MTGASDKTLRQWDLATGQCVLTMDILWAISHPQVSATGTSLSSPFFTNATVGNFAVPTPPYADGSWEMYQDFIGAVQFWGYGLVSGSGDGAVRMWDSKSFVVCWPSVNCHSAHGTSPSNTGWAHWTSDLPPI